MRSVRSIQTQSVQYMGLVPSSAWVHPVHAGVNRTACYKPVLPQGSLPCNTKIEMRGVLRSDRAGALHRYRKRVGGLLDTLGFVLKASCTAAYFNVIVLAV